MISHVYTSSDHPSARRLLNRASPNVEQHSSTLGQDLTSCMLVSVRGHTVTIFTMDGQTAFVPLCHRASILLPMTHDDRGIFTTTTSPHRGMFHDVSTRRPAENSALAVISPKLVFGIRPLRPG